jgi:hypothetical protein
MSDVTYLLNAIEAAHQAAAQLLPLVYDELRRLAAQKLAQEAPGQTLHQGPARRLACSRIPIVSPPSHYPRFLFTPAHDQLCRDHLAQTLGKHQLGANHPSAIASRWHDFPARGAWHGNTSPHFT